MMYNQWVQGGTNDLASSQEFNKIASKYRINEIGKTVKNNY